MADLTSLIRVRKHDVEQKQKMLAALYKRADDVKRQREELEATLAIEAEKVEGLAGDMRGYFLNYAENVKAKIAQLDLLHQQVEQQISLAQDAVRDAFADLKKIEIIDERRQHDERQEQQKKEDDIFDDIALDAHRRRGD